MTGQVMRSSLMMIQLIRMSYSDLCSWSNSYGSDLRLIALHIAHYKTSHNESVACFITLIAKIGKIKMTPAYPIHSPNNYNNNSHSSMINNKLFIYYDYLVMT